MSFVSYAQNAEDVVLARAFPRAHKGFYVDVGASDPTVDSVTKSFYDIGWSGINVEPSAAALSDLVTARPRDVNLGVGLGETPGVATFYELPRQMMGCSTLVPDLAEGYRQDGWIAQAREIEITTLAEICSVHVGEKTIDFLKIDVEGTERSVLAGADFERFRPRLLLVEATRPGTPVPAYADWEPSVLSAGYEFALFDGLNRFYVREEDHDLAEGLAAPANYFDDYLPYKVLGWRQAAERGEQAEVGRQAAEAARRRAESEAAAERQARAHAESEIRQAASTTADALRGHEVARDQSRQLELALQRTRDVLAASRGALRDARIELAASRRALTNLVEHSGSRRR
jgi:FkbM family methyltransferase